MSRDLLDQPERPVVVSASDLTPAATVPALQGDPLNSSGGELSGAGETEDTDAPALTEPDQPDETDLPAEKRVGHLAAHELDNIAMLVVGGASYDSIATSTGLDRDRIQRLVSNKGYRRFHRLLEKRRAQALRVTSGHQMRMLNLMEYSYEAIKRAMIQDEDPKLAKETAFDLIDRVFPLERKADVEVNMGFQNVHLNTAVANTFTRIGEGFEKLLGAVATQDPTQYLRDESPGYTIRDAETVDPAAANGADDEPDTPPAAH